MARRLLTSLLLLPFAAAAQYKCVAPDGGVSFQQAPCAASTKQSTLDIRYDKGPAERAASAPPVPRSDKERLAALERERKIRDLQYGIRDSEQSVDHRTAAMEAELADIRSRKASANKNLAGAVYEQSLSAEMQAAATKHQALIDVEMSRLKNMREELARLQASN